MSKREYHYLVAGLADLVFDSSKGASDIAEFREELKSALHPSDYAVVSILFLPHDNKNLMTYLEGGSGEWDNLGIYSLQDMEEQKRITESILREEDILPPYMVKAIRKWFDSGSANDRFETERILTEGYIDTALASGNRFLMNYVSFDRDMKNVIALISSKALGLDADDFISGDYPLARRLREIFKSSRDFQIPPEPDYVPDMFRIMTEEEFLERERKIDLARWEFINSETFFDYFSVDWIMGYLIKLSIVTRWKQLDPETGKIMLRNLVEEMKPSANTVHTAGKQEEEGN
ncbi:MAG TPA: DUF2764 family protein [Bacteroidales bacterium]|mgnify:FL=1|nr:DUF2764 family protein [Bacteroidales bacterium]